jgi:hypothetical protein
VKNSAATSPDVEMQQGWGMTEMSPIGSCSRPLPNMDEWVESEKTKSGRSKAGPCMELK